MLCGRPVVALEDDHGQLVGRAVERGEQAAGVGDEPTGRGLVAAEEFVGSRERGRDGDPQHPPARDHVGRRAEDLSGGVAGDDHGPARQERAHDRRTKEDVPGGQEPLGENGDGFFR